MFEIKAWALCSNMYTLLHSTGSPLNILLQFLAHSCAHGQAVNKYRGGEMSMEVVVERNLWTENVDHRRK